MHLKPLPQLGCSPTKHGKRLQFISRGVIFQKLHVASGDITQFIPFVCAFYAFESPLFDSHRNHESDVIVILFAMGTCQGDPLGGALFAIAHFKALCSTTSHFPSCLVLSIENDTHIVTPLSIDHFHMNISR